MPDKIIPVFTPYLAPSAKQNLLDCIESGWISSGGVFVNQFEKAWANKCNVEFGIAVNSGTSALEIAVRALELDQDAEIILPSYTIISCASAILNAGCTISLVDVDPDTWCLNIDQIKDKITNKTQAIMPVHMFGHPANMSEIMTLARSHSLKIIEDAAEAHGALADGRVVGGIGDMGCFSFYANKIITTGEGGMVTFNNRIYFDKAKNLKELAFGRKDKFMHADIGYNYRMTNLQAALGLGQMKKINHFIKKKIKISKWYSKYLNVDKLILPHTKKNYKNVFWMYCVRLKEKNKKNRSKIRKKLSSVGIETREMFIPANLQEIFLKKKMFKKIECPKANQVSSTTFYLPSGYELKEKNVKYISDQLNKLL